MPPCRLRALAVDMPAHVPQIVHAANICYNPDEWTYSPRIVMIFVGRHVYATIRGTGEFSGYEINYCHNVLATMQVSNTLSVGNGDGVGVALGVLVLVSGRLLVSPTPRRPLMQVDPSDGMLSLLANTPSGGNIPWTMTVILHTTPLHPHCNTC